MYPLEARARWARWPTRRQGIALCTAVLALPTFLMGGTLPATMRALERTADRSRRTVGLLYGVNTVGAVLGTLWATFVSLERRGTTVTLLGSGVVNLIVAAVAFAVARRNAARRAPPGGQSARSRDRSSVPTTRCRPRRWRQCGSIEHSSHASQKSPISASTFSEQLEPR